MPRSGRLTADFAVPVAQSIGEGMPNPAALVSGVRTPCTASTSWSISVSVDRLAVGTIAGSDSVPSEESTAVATFVPPTSMPT